MTEALSRAESLIRTIPDYPEAGVLFRDITPLLADASALRTVIHALVEPFAGEFDVVAGVEARTLTVMASGDREAFERVLPLFDAFAATVIWVGAAPGQG